VYWLFIVSTSQKRQMNSNVLVQWL